MRPIPLVTALIAALVAALVAGGCSRVLPPAAAASAPTPVEQAIARDLVARINAERAARGIAPVHVDPRLVDRSVGWSRDMGRGGGFRHSDLQPLLVTFAAAAENIAWTRGGTAGLVHVKLMESAGHRQNILAPNVDAVGVGVSCAQNREMWVTEEFGRYPASSRPAGFGGVPAATPVARGDIGSRSC